MMKRESAIQSTASNFVTSWINIAIGIVTGIVVTRSLGPELKGEFVNLKLILTLYVPLLLFGYSGGVLYYGLKKQIDIKHFFWSGFVMTLVLGVVLIPFLYPLIIQGWLGSIAAGSTSNAILLTLGVAPVFLLNVYSDRILRSFHLFKASNIRIVVGATATLGYVLCILLISKIDLNQALIGFIVGQVIQLCLNIWFVVRHIGARWKLERNNILLPWRYGSKTWINQIISRSNDRFDQIVLTFFLAAGPFAIYCVGVALSNLLTQIPSSYVNVFFNQIADREPDDALKLYAKAQRITFLITSIMALGLAVSAYPLIYIVYGSEFTAAAWVVVLYTPGLIFQVAARLSVKFYAGIGQPLKNSLIYLFGFSVSLPVFFLLIPRMGINGAAIGSSVAYLSAFLFSFYQINREFGLRLRDIVGIRRDDVIYVRSQLSKLSILGRKFSV